MSTHGNFGKRYIVPGKISPALLAASRDDLIWAAGLFEGEGSVFVERKQGRRLYVTPRMSLNTTDKDVIDRFQAIMGGRVNLQKNQSHNHKPQWKWTLHGYENAVQVLVLWGRWLGKRRTRQFEDTLQACDEVRCQLLPSQS